ncbi:ParB/RepB/Spo0J family partition protein [Streptomyces sp. NPDC051582]|uniref:ParB/RepB/Spo0J family partition protein n=1 Tax=Streptomyces sp. NPDC051582 TaxID=3155167 RepID=UPI003417B9FC
MPTALLNDQKIHPIEFRKWADAERQFARGKDRQRVDELKASIKKRGLLKPIKLGVSVRYPDVYVGDGHHRAIALRELGIADFPFHWYWIKSFGVHIETEPFPYRLLDA